MLYQQQIKPSLDPDFGQQPDTATCSQSVYGSMSPDALALLEKLPIGSIEGVHYDSSAGRVLIDKESPQSEEERITKFQSAYQSIVGRKLKIIQVPVPHSASPDAVASLVDQYNLQYDQCVFRQEENIVKVISISSRQHDQARTLLADELVKLANSAAPKTEVISLSDGRRLTLKKANIVKEDVDVIVNPANSRLKHGGGVAKALNDASGGKLQEYSDRYTKKKNQVPTGKVAATQGGGNLKCKFVLHAVGPSAANNQAECELLLNSVVNEVLKCAEKRNAISVSFPAISSGLFGVKKELVARCVVDSIMAFHFTSACPVLSDIRIVIIDEETYTPFAHYFKQKQRALGTAKGEHKPLIHPSKLNPSQLHSKKPFTSPPSLECVSDKLTDKKDIPVATPLASATKTPGKVTSYSKLVNAQTRVCLFFSDITLSLKDIGKIRTFLSNMADNWLILGSLLGFKKDLLEQISATPADSSVQLNRVLNKWLSGDANPPTVSVLVNALGGIEGTAAVVRTIMTGIISIHTVCL